MEKEMNGGFPKYVVGEVFDCCVHTQEKDQVFVKTATTYLSRFDEPRYSPD